MKDAIFGDRPLVYLAYILIAVAFAWIAVPPGGPMRLLLAIVTAALALEFAISMLDGADGGRHLTLFGYLLDLLVCCDVVFAARRFVLKPAASADREHWRS